MTIKLRCDTGKIVATYNAEHKTLTRRLRGSKHLLRSPRAICFNASIIAQAGSLGCLSIKVLDVETDITYLVSFANFRAKAIPLNRGFGAQLALPLAYWNSEGNEVWKSAPIPAKQVTIDVQDVQLSLF